MIGDYNNKMADEQNMLQFANLTRYVYARKPREILPRNDPFQSYDDEKFKRRFRISKLAVEKLLEQVCNCAKFALQFTHCRTNIALIIT